MAGLTSRLTLKSSISPLNRKPSRLKKHDRSRTRTCPSSVIWFVMVLLLLNMITLSTSMPSLVKVCGPRELKEVTESICSTLGKRDLNPFTEGFFKRVRRMTASDMAVSCCREACSLSYYALLCDWYYSNLCYNHFVSSLLSNPPINQSTRQLLMTPAHQPYSYR
jgi:hypothetical protein